MAIIIYRLRICVFIGLLLSGLRVVGQQAVTTVTGQVVDAANGEPLGSVTVSFTGGNATRTDSLGRFGLSGAGNFSQVAFSCVGYLPMVKQIVPAQANKLQVLLESSAKEL